MKRQVFDDQEDKHSDKCSCFAGKFTAQLWVVGLNCEVLETWKHTMSHVTQPRVLCVPGCFQQLVFSISMFLRLTILSSRPKWLATIQWYFLINPGSFQELSHLWMFDANLHPLCVQTSCSHCKGLLSIIILCIALFWLGPWDEFSTNAWWRAVQAAFIRTWQGFNIW